MTPRKSEISLRDSSVFFEKTLRFGVEKNILSIERMEYVRQEGPKAILQLADHFGTRHLQEDLENAKKRVVNLVSLCLEEQSEGNLTKAAISLRDQPFLLHSKKGADLLRKLNALPEFAIVGDVERMTSEKTFLDERSLKRPTDSATYQRELDYRQKNAEAINVAIHLGMGLGESIHTMKDNTADSIIRSALLLRLFGKEIKKIPTRTDFLSIVVKLRASKITKAARAKISPDLSDIPANFHPLILEIADSMFAYDVPKMTDAKLSFDELMSDLTGEKSLRYFIREDLNEDCASYDAIVSKEWNRITKGHVDSYSLITAFLMMAAKMPVKHSITEAEGRKMIRTFRSEGFDHESISKFITESAPFEMREDVLDLWDNEFVPEAQMYLLDKEGTDQKLVDGMQFLKRNVNFKKKAA